jgi:glycosyltransferase involved in cell wall biosynthesis
MPKVSIALLTYNRPFYLKLSLEAVLNQSYKDYELIILDNGSDRATFEVAKQFINSQVKYFRNPVNSTDFHNRAFDMALGDYLLITHDDDIMEPDFLKREVQILDEFPEVVLVTTNISQINSESVVLKKVTHPIIKDRVWRKHQYINYYLLNGNILPCPTFMLRLKVIKDYGIKINTEVGPMADLYLVFQLNLLDFTIYLIKEPLYKYTVHNQQDSELNRIAMEMKITPHIKKLLAVSDASYLASKYEQSSLAQIAYLLVYKYISGSIGFQIYKENMRNLKLKGLMLNRYLILWSIIGLLRGIKKRFGKMLN